MNIIKMGFLLLVLVIVSACSNNSKDGDINPIGTNLGGSGEVKVTIGITTGQYDLDQDGNLDEAVIFTATPNVSVNITKVTYSLPAQQINDSYTLDGTAESPANQPENFLFAPTSSIVTGQQWTFQFEGKTSSDEKSFNTSVNFTVPNGFGDVTGGGNVTITIGTSTEQQDIDNDGNLDEVLYFTGTPSVNIKLSKVTASLAAQQYSESFDFSTVAEFQANVPGKLIGYLKSNIIKDQQWTFRFEGITTSDNKQFDITANYTIP